MAVFQASGGTTVLGPQGQGAGGPQRAQALAARAGSSVADRLAAVERELRGIRKRAAKDTFLTGGAAVVRDAITGSTRS